MATTNVPEFTIHPTTDVYVYGIRVNNMLAAMLHRVVPTNALTQLTKAEFSAMAKLFTAAPDLLEALSMIVDASDPDGYGPKTDASIPALRHGLTKARLALALFSAPEGV